jgi:hypothetical protein
LTASLFQVGWSRSTEPMQKFGEAVRADIGAP